MGIFSFIETFFFLSLAVSFVLILLLVYHFKQRISLLERKYDTVVCIINDVATELTMIKCASPGGFSCPMVYSPHHGGIMFGSDTNNNNNVEEIIEGDNGEGEEESEEESEGEESESESEDESEDESEGEESEGEEEEAKIVVSDTDEPDTKRDILLDASEEDTNMALDFEVMTEEPVEASTTAEVIVQDAKSDTEEEEDAIKKMSLSSLKQLAVSKGLVHDSSKMKKSDLLQLLSRS